MAHRGGQGFEVGGLVEKEIGAGRGAAAAEAGVVGEDGDDGGRRFQLHLAQQGHAAAVGHLDVQDQQFGAEQAEMAQADVDVREPAVEGSQQLVDRALENAQKNGLDRHTEFAVANLFEMTEDWLARLGPFDRMLIDPPRDGAMELVKSIPEVGGPKRIVYVSCNPATLARDANVLVNVKGYKLKAAGVMNMFPHTAHVESMAWFEKE